MNLISCNEYNVYRFSIFCVLNFFKLDLVIYKLIQENTTNTKYTIKGEHIFTDNKSRGFESSILYY